MSAVLRPLGASKQYFWFSDQNSPKHFGLAARITGGVEPEKWQTAIATVRLRHPLLRSAIVLDESGTPTFVEADSTSIPIRFVRTDDTSWEEVMAQEHAEPLRCAQGELVRIALTQLPLGTVLLLSMDHSTHVSADKLERAIQEVEALATWLEDCLVRVQYPNYKG